MNSLLIGLARWIKIFLVLILAGSATAVVVVLTGRAFIAIGTGILLLLAAMPVVHWWRRGRAIREFRATHSHYGRDLLLVVTASPHWLPYIEHNWLPRWHDRMVLWNRSEPWSSASVEARIWQSFAGWRAHTPIAIVIPARGKPTVVRLWQAFRDYKHGNDAALRSAEAALIEALQLAAGGEA